MTLRTGLGILGMAALVASGIGAYMAVRGGKPSQTEIPQAGVGWAATPRAVADVGFEGAAAKRHTLADFRGRLVLLNLWATWCAPCREEMPALDRLQQALGGPDFEVVALSIDKDGMASVRRFYDEMGIRALAPYVDPSMRAGTELRIVGVPTTLLLDRQGGERWRKTGPEKWDAPDLVAALRKRMRENAAR